MIVLAALFMLVMRIMAKNGGIGGIGSVGKSNATVYMEKSTGVTFKDVAGQDEAKELSLIHILPCRASSRAISWTVSWMASRLYFCASLASSNLPAVAPFSASTRICRFFWVESVTTSPSSSARCV